MTRARAISVVLAGIIVLISAVDCLGFASSIDEQSMKCCESMLCTPAIQAHGCCKKILSGHPQYFQPATKVSVQPPAGRVFDLVAELSLGSIPALRVPPLDANEHAPPRELYTVYLSLLI